MFASPNRNKGRCFETNPDREIGALYPLLNTLSGLISLISILSVSLHLSGDHLTTLSGSSRRGERMEWSGQECVGSVTGKQTSGTSQIV